MYLFVFVVFLLCVWLCATSNRERPSLSLSRFIADMLFSVVLEVIFLAQVRRDETGTCDRQGDKHM